MEFLAIVGNTDLESNKSSWPWKSIALNEPILNHQKGLFFPLATLRDSTFLRIFFLFLFAKESIYLSCNISLSLLSMNIPKREQ